MENHFDILMSHDKKTHPVYKMMKNPLKDILHKDIIAWVFTSFKFFVNIS